MSYEWNCPKCNKTWFVTKHHSPMRDKDSIECDCGTVIESWNGGVMYTARLKPNSPVMNRQ